MSSRHFFLHIFFARRADIAHTHGSRCLQCARHISPSHFVPSHVSSTVFAVSARSLRHLVPVCTCLAELFPIRKRGSSARAARSLATWPIPRTPHVMSPSADGDTTPVNDPNYDNISDFSKSHARTLDFSVFPQMLEASGSHVSHGGSKDSMHRETVISVAESMSKKSRQNSIRSHSRQTLRKFCSDE